MVTIPAILRDKNGRPIPQIWDTEIDQWKRFEVQSPIEQVVWNNESSGENGESSVFDSKNYANLTIIGEASEATSIEVMASLDNENYYVADRFIIQEGGSDFHAWYSWGARYVKLKSSEDVTITAKMQAKP